MRLEFVLKTLLPILSALICLLFLVVSPATDARYVLLCSLLVAICSYFLVEVVACFLLGGRGLYRARHQARYWLDENQAGLRAFRQRLSAEHQQELSAALERAKQSLLGSDLGALQRASNELEALHKGLSLRRKSALREYVESVGGAILVALLLRAFWVEPFQIPSGSMIPTLRVGDFIFVSKSHYGLKLPFTNLMLWEYRKPSRGDIIVFSHPNPGPDDIGKDLIKRVVAVEGDKLSMFNNVLTLNGKVLKLTDEQEFAYLEEGGLLDMPSMVEDVTRYQEDLLGYRHPLLYRIKYAEDDQRQQACDGSNVLSRGTKCWENRGANCRWSKAPTYQGPELCVPVDDPARPFVVPPGYVFVMGDNRDNSDDSRGWGPVPLDHIKGKAVFVWFAGKILWPPKVNWDRFFTKIE
jgi:signal peptidase I